MLPLRMLPQNRDYKVPLPDYFMGFCAHQISCTLQGIGDFLIYLTGKINRQTFGFAKAIGIGVCPGSWYLLVYEEFDIYKSFDLGLANSSELKKLSLP